MLLFVRNDKMASKSLLNRVLATGRHIALITTTATAAFAQTVHWDPPSGQLGFNQVSQISLVFENCEPDGAPALPQVEGLIFGRPSQSSQTSIVNFTMTRTFSLVYPVRPSKKITLSIPAFEVKTDKGAIRVSPANFTVGDASVGNTGLSVDDVASAKLSVAKTAFWAGEVFPVTYTLSIIRRNFYQLAPNIEWPASPLIAEEWSKNDLSEATVGGEHRVLSVQNTRAYSKQAGTFTLSPVSQMANLVVGSTGFGIFSQPNVEQRQLETNPLTVTIKPLPTPPPDFSGAVGDFTFTSKVIPTSGAVGEPITWTVELSGVGNWPDITGLPQRDVSNDFQIVQPKSKRTMKEGALFEGTLLEDVVLVPTRAGSYRLAPVHFTYFDPKSGSYKTISSEPVTVNVTASASSTPAPNTANAPIQFSLPSSSNATPPAPTLPNATPPAAPENLPRDVLPESAHGIVPFQSRTFWIIFITPAVLAIVVVWFFLAAVRSKETDPQRLRRAAKMRLTTLLGEIRAAGNKPGELTARLAAWQREVAALWEIPHAAPGVKLVEARVTAQQKEDASRWAQLWTDAERAQHSRDHTLPSDWISRANTALDSVAIPGWSPLALFNGRNLLPFLFTLLVMVAPLTVHAGDPADAYKRGEFPAAEADWRKTLESSPSDWATRHNLGLALAQQDRWAEAAAQWTGAFLLNPRSDLTRYDLALGLQRSGLAPSELVEFSRGKNRFKLARMASAGEWEIVLFVAALLLAAAVIILLVQGYRRTLAWAKPTALGISLVAVLLAVLATLSLRVYGPLAEPEAAMVWKASTLFSIPTEADTTQKTSPLSAGSLAVVEKTFLGWSKLQFPGGQIGWVHSEDLVKVYR